MLTLITNRKLCEKGRFISHVTEAVGAGVDRVILREKDMDDAELAKLARALKAGMKDGKRLIVHTSIRAAKDCHAHGVHFTYHRFSQLADYEKKSLKEEDGFVLGVSVHSEVEACKAESLGADYLLASHVFDTACKAGTPGRGLDFIESVCRAVKIPVIGLGGIDESNAKSVMDSGAAGVALMSGIMSAKDVTTTCKGLADALN